MSAEKYLFQFVWNKYPLKKVNLQLNLLDSNCRRKKGQDNKYLEPLDSKEVGKAVAWRKVKSKEVGAAG